MVLLNFELHILNIYIYIKGTLYFVHFIEYTFNSLKIWPTSPCTHWKGRFPTNAENGGSSGILFSPYPLEKEIKTSTTKIFYRYGKY